jgi:hypothetical protein
MVVPVRFVGSVPAFGYVKVESPKGHIGEGFGWQGRLRGKVLGGSYAHGSGE